jgi:hypothetical protein
LRAEREPLAWSDRELNEMSMITDHNRRQADIYWRRLLPEQFRDLLAAVRSDESGRSARDPLEPGSGDLEYVGTFQIWPTRAKGRGSLEDR